ncbi:MAG: addiction module protein [Verrucomicrobiota bacterium]
MTTSEKLQTMESLWESLSKDNQFNAPDWHDDILKKRAKRITSNEAKYLTLADLKKKLAS